MDLLADLPVFSKLKPDDRAELIELASRRRFERGQFICMQGDTWPYALYLKSGKVAWTMLSPEGRRQVAFHLQAGDLAWGISMIDGQPMPATLEVIYGQAWTSDGARARGNHGEFEIPLERLRRRPS